MTDNMKKFLEEASKDSEFSVKLKKTETPEEFIALAAEKGFALTPEDLKNEPPAVAEMSDDELDAVAGGKKCYCAVGGGGTKSSGETTCACVAQGMGYIYDEYGEKRLRCVCPLGGYGEDKILYND